MSMKVVSTVFDTWTKYVCTSDGSWEKMWKSVIDGVPNEIKYNSSMEWLAGSWSTRCVDQGYIYVYEN